MTKRGGCFVGILLGFIAGYIMVGLAHTVVVALSPWWLGMGFIRQIAVVSGTIFASLGAVIGWKKGDI